MKMERQKSIASLVTAVFLAVNQIALPLSYAVGQVYPLEDVKAPASFQLDIPSDLGTVQALSAGTGPTLIHIQDAHGNYEAQKKIKAILHYLKQVYGIRLVLLEGSAYKLRPELIRLFPKHMDITKEVLDELAKDAVAQGEELFLAEADDVEAYGIENLQAYLSNDNAFKAVLVQQEKTRGFIQDMNMQIGRLTGPYLNKDLRTFLKRLESFEAKELPLWEWLNYLKAEAQKNLSIDLADPAYQLDWPTLLRIFKMGEFEAKINKKAFVTERDQFLATAALRTLTPDDFNEIQNLLSSPISRHQLPDPGTSQLFEKMIKALPGDFNYDDFPNVKYFIGHLILQSEVKGERLVQEMERLTDRVSTELAKTKEEKKILGLLKDHRLLKKLFALELTPEEYEKLIQLGESVRPSAVIQRFQSLNGDKRVRDVEFTHTGEIDSLFAKAAEFYRGVKERDQWMLENVRARMKEAGEDKAVVITGGFHAGPFKDHFQASGFNYALIAPKITTVESRDAYIHSILDYEIKTHKPVQKLAFARPELRAQGVDPARVKLAELGKSISVTSRHGIQIPAFNRMLPGGPLEGSVVGPERGANGQSGFGISFDDGKYWVPSTQTTFTTVQTVSLPVMDPNQIVTLKTPKRQASRPETRMLVLGRKPGEKVFITGKGTLEMMVQSPLPRTGVALVFKIDGQYIGTETLRVLGEKLEVPEIPVTVTFVERDGNKIRLGFEAPREVDIERDDIGGKKPIESKTIAPEGYKVGDSFMVKGTEIKVTITDISSTGVVQFKIDSPKNRYWVFTQEHFKDLAIGYGLRPTRPAEGTRSVTLHLAKTQKFVFGSAAKKTGNRDSLAELTVKEIHTKTQPHTVTLDIQSRPEVREEIKVVMAKGVARVSQNLGNNLLLNIDGIETDPAKGNQAHVQIEYSKHSVLVWEDSSFAEWLKVGDSVTTLSGHVTAKLLSLQIKPRDNVVLEFEINHRAEVRSSELILAAGRNRVAQGEPLIFESPERFLVYLPGDFKLTGEQQKLALRGFVVHNGELYSLDPETGVMGDKWVQDPSLGYTVEIKNEKVIVNNLNALGEVVAEPLRPEVRANPLTKNAKIFGGLDLREVAALSFKNAQIHYGSTVVVPLNGSPIGQLVRNWDLEVEGITHGKFVFNKYSHATISALIRSQLLPIEPRDLDRVNFEQALQAIAKTKPLNIQFDHLELTSDGELRLVGNVAGRILQRLQLSLKAAGFSLKEKPGTIYVVLGHLDTQTLAKLQGNEARALRGWIDRTSRALKRHALSLEVNQIEVVNYYHRLLGQRIAGTVKEALQPIILQLGQPQESGESLKGRILNEWEILSGVLKHGIVSSYYQRSQFDNIELNKYSNFSNVVIFGKELKDLKPGKEVPARISAMLGTQSDRFQIPSFAWQIITQSDGSAVVTVNEDYRGLRFKVVTLLQEKFDADEDINWGWRSLEVLSGGEEVKKKFLFEGVRYVVVISKETEIKKTGVGEPVYRIRLHKGTSNGPQVIFTVNKHDDIEISADEPDTGKIFEGMMDKKLDDFLATLTQALSRPEVRKETDLPGLKEGSLVWIGDNSVTVGKISSSGPDKKNTVQLEMDVIGNKFPQSLESYERVKEGGFYFEKGKVVQKISPHRYEGQQILILQNKVKEGTDRDIWARIMVKEVSSGTVTLKIVAEDEIRIEIEKPRSGRPEVRGLVQHISPEVSLGRFIASILETTEVNPMEFSEGELRRKIASNAEYYIKNGLSREYVKRGDKPESTYGLTLKGKQFHRSFKKGIEASHHAPISLNLLMLTVASSFFYLAADPFTFRELDALKIVGLSNSREVVEEAVRLKYLEKISAPTQRPYLFQITHQGIGFVAGLMSGDPYLIWPITREEAIFLQTLATHPAVKGREFIFPDLRTLGVNEIEKISSHDFNRWAAPQGFIKVTGEVRFIKNKKYVVYQLTSRGQRFGEMLQKKRGVSSYAFDRQTGTSRAEVRSAEAAGKEKELKDLEIRKVSLEGTIRNLQNRLARMRERLFETNDEERRARIKKFNEELDSAQKELGIVDARIRALLPEQFSRHEVRMGHDMPAWRAFQGASPAVLVKKLSALLDRVERKYKDSPEITQAARQLRKKIDRLRASEVEFLVIYLSYLRENAFSLYLWTRFGHTGLIPRSLGLISEIIDSAVEIFPQTKKVTGTPIYIHKTSNPVTQEEIKTLAVALRTLKKASPSHYRQILKFTKLFSLQEDLGPQNWGSVNPSNYSVTLLKTPFPGDKLQMIHTIIEENDHLRWVRKKEDFEKALILNPDYEFKKKRQSPYATYHSPWVYFAEADAAMENATAFAHLARLEGTLKALLLQTASLRKAESFIRPLKFLIGKKVLTQEGEERVKQMETRLVGKNVADVLFQMLSEAADDEIDFRNADRAEVRAITALSDRVFLLPEKSVKLEGAEILPLDVSSSQAVGVIDKLRKLDPNIKIPDAGMVIFIPKKVLSDANEGKRQGLILETSLIAATSVLTSEQRKDMLTLTKGIFQNPKMFAHLDSTGVDFDAIADIVGEALKIFVSLAAMQSVSFNSDIPNQLAKQGMNAFPKMKSVWKDQYEAINKNYTKSRPEVRANYLEVNRNLKFREEGDQIILELDPDAQFAVNRGQWFMVSLHPMSREFGELVEQFGFPTFKFAAGPNKGAIVDDHYLAQQIQAAFSVLQQYAVYSSGKSMPGLEIPKVTLSYKITFDGKRITVASEEVGEALFDLETGGPVVLKRKVLSVPNDLFYIYWSQLGLYLPIYFHDDARAAFRNHFPQKASIQDTVQAVRAAYSVLKGAVVSLEGKDIVVADKMDVSKLNVKGVHDLSKLTGEDKIKKIIELDPVVLMVRSATIVDEALVRQLKRLKHIVRLGHGLDNVQVAKQILDERGITVEGSKGSGRSVLAWVLRTAAIAKQMRDEKGKSMAGPEKDEAPGSFLPLPSFLKASESKISKRDILDQPILRAKAGEILRPLGGETISSLKGTTLGVIGAGNIGSELVSAARALGMKILVNTRTMESDVTKRPVPEVTGYQFATKEEIQQNAHFVVLLTGLNPQTKGMIDDAAVNRMIANPNLIALINPDRGGVVDKKAVARLVREKQVQYLVDEIPKTDELKQLALYTDHIGGSTEEAEAGVLEKANQILDRIISTSRSQVQLSEGVKQFLAGRPHPVFITSYAKPAHQSEGIIVYVNEAFANLFGKRPEELIGKTYREINPPDAPVGDYEADDRAAIQKAEGDIIQKLEPNKTAGGTVEVVKLRYAGPETESKAADYVLGIFVDTYFRGTVTRDNMDERLKETLEGVEARVRLAKIGAEAQSIRDRFPVYAGGVNHALGFLDQAIEFLNQGDKDVAVVRFSDALDSLRKQEKRPDLVEELEQVFGRLTRAEVRTELSVGSDTVEGVKIKTSYFTVLHRFHIRIDGGSNDRVVKLEIWKQGFATIEEAKAQHQAVKRLIEDNPDRIREEIQSHFAGSGFKVIVSPRAEVRKAEGERRSAFGAVQRIDFPKLLASLPLASSPEIALRRIFTDYLIPFERVASILALRGAGLLTAVNDRLGIQLAEAAVAQAKVPGVIEGLAASQEVKLGITDRIFDPAKKAEDYSLFLVSNDWLHEYKKKPVVLYNLLKGLDRLREMTAMTEPRLVVAEDKEEFLAEVEPVLTNSKNGLSIVDRAEVRMLLDKVRGDKLIRFIDTAEIAAFVQMNAPRLGVAYLHSDREQAIRGALSFLVVGKKIANKTDRDGIMIAFPFGAMLAAKLAKDVQDPKEKYTIVAIPLQQSIFPGAQFKFNGREVEAVSFDQYLVLAYQGQKLVAVAA